MDTTTIPPPRFTASEDIYVVLAHFELTLNSVLKSSPRIN